MYACIKRRSRATPIQSHQNHSRIKYLCEVLSLKLTMIACIILITFIVLGLEDPSVLSLETDKTSDSKWQSEIECIARKKELKENMEMGQNMITTCDVEVRDLLTTLQEKTRTRAQIYYLLQQCEYNTAQIERNESQTNSDAGTHLTCVEDLAEVMQNLSWLTELFVKCTTTKTELNMRISETQKNTNSIANLYDSCIKEKEYKKNLL